MRLEPNYITGVVCDWETQAPIRSWEEVKAADQAAEAYMANKQSPVAANRECVCGTREGLHSAYCPRGW